MTSTSPSDAATISFEGGELSYRSAGSGRPLVLQHGLGCSSLIWSDVSERLGSDLWIVTPDLRGSGDSRANDGGALSLDRWARDLRAVVEAAGLERPTLVGHSLGASVALAYALRWPQDVRALVLMGADAHLSQLAPRMQSTVELIESVGLPAWVAEHWSRNPPFSGASLDRSPEILERYRQMVLANDPESYCRTCLAIAGADDLSGRLSELELPTLVIAGAEDDRTPPEASRALAAALPNATLVELAAVGHTLPLEAPEEVAGAVLEFLERT